MLCFLSRLISQYHFLLDYSIQAIGVSCLFTLFAVSHSSPPCPLYGCPRLYLPAPPGETPPCAKNGQTYCEHIDNYPQQLITTLVAAWQYDYNTLFGKESPSHGPPRPSHSWDYPYPPKTKFPSHYEGPLPSLNQHLSSLFNDTDGYPDRKYPLGNPNLQTLGRDPGFIYSAILQPDLIPPVTHYDPGHWWKRYKRASRKKRQANGEVSLCPTRTQFIQPKAAVNNQGDWKFVVNLDQDQRFRQLVGSETCISRTCNGICSLPNGYSSKCEQQFVQKRLIALDGGGNSLYTDLFWLPHCCVCKITPT